MLNKFQKASLFISEFVADAFSYMRYCNISPVQDENRRLFYRILIEAHALEKGLSLKKTRPFFGKTKIIFLKEALLRYDLSYSRLPAEMTCGVFRAYLQFHKDNGHFSSVLDELDAYVERYVVKNSIEPNGGLREFGENDCPEAPASSQLLLSRHSTRSYQDNCLAGSEVNQIVRMAQSAPSQCNRQSSKVYFYQEREDIDHLLKLQSGAAGFSQDVNNLFVISSDIIAWGGAQQRNQAYIDGALFAMNLMLACHSYGVATCPLNLAVTHRVEKAIKRVGNIGVDERLVMMISAGYPVNKNIRKVTKSPRRPLDEILTCKLKL